MENVDVVFSNVTCWKKRELVLFERMRVKAHVFSLLPVCVSHFPSITILTSSFVTIHSLTYKHTPL
jgi:hypothetical protein